jgi:Rad3-related DNA helicase
MRKLSLKLAVVALYVGVCGCPGPNVGGTRSDPYLVAHTVINQASLALTVAEGIFNQWVYAQTDSKKVDKAQLTFAKVKTLVANGLKLAHDGVYIAEQAKKDPDVVKLLLQADNAWDDLRQFLGALLDDGNHGIVTEVAQEEVAAAKDVPGGVDVSVRMQAMTSQRNPMEALPVSIIPDM